VFVSPWNRTGALSPDNREKRSAPGVRSCLLGYSRVCPFWLWHSRRAASSGRGKIRYPPSPVASPGPRPTGPRSRPCRSLSPILFRRGASYHGPCPGIDFERAWDGRAPKKLVTGARKAQALTGNRHAGSNPRISITFQLLKLERRPSRARRAPLPTLGWRRWPRHNPHQSPCRPLYDE
jgi:hypothetical protein